MKILVLSDSHRSTRNSGKVFDKLHNVFDEVVHLGDCYGDMFTFIKKYPEIKFHSIAGNCDFNTQAKDEAFLDVNGKKIFLTHGHKYCVKYGYEELVDGAIEKGADMCLFGHTHQPELFEKNGVIFMNPGSITFPRDRYGPSYGIIDIDDNGKTCVSIVEFGQKVIFQL